MDDVRNNHSSAPQLSVASPARRGTWTARIILWTLACVVGLWLGTGSRGVAGGRENSRSVVTQAALADVFRFDILLAGKEPALRRARPKPPVQEAKCDLPPAFVAALAQRPEPVYAAMPKTLSGTHPRFLFTPPARPAGPWRIKVTAPTYINAPDMARLEQAQKQLQATLAMVPGITAADRKSIQTEVDNACTRIDSIRKEQLRHVSEWPEPPGDTSQAWPGRGMQLMP